MTEFRTSPAATQPSRTPFIIGTAGHIDHGKTSLVRLLTGINTDRLPEERARGISIDLGFAFFETARFQFGVVDVPGHIRFIRNMVAGATGIDLALLVVAADDSVMPQTREHLEILELLGIKSGLIVITKSDLVNSEMISLVTAEVEELVLGTRFENAPIVCVSSLTGNGLSLLRDTLDKIADSIPVPPERTVFRMPIDRVFSIPGQGTVVTGTVLSGMIDKGGLVELLPERILVRVRGVQNHGRGLLKSSSRRRTGINLAGVKCDAVRRGQELASPGYFRPSTRLLVSLQVLRSSPEKLRTRRSLKLHIGTGEVTARIIIPNGEVQLGGSGFAELRLEHPIVAEYGQRFILRQLSPALTVGGGIILDPQLDLKWRIPDLQALAEARASDLHYSRIESLLSFRIRTDITHSELACRTGVSLEECPVILNQMQVQGRLRIISRHSHTCYVVASQWQHFLNSSIESIERLFKIHHPRRVLSEQVIHNAVRAVTPDSLTHAVLAELKDMNWLVTDGANWGPTELQIKLSHRQRDLQFVLIERVKDAGLAPPFLKELAALLEHPLEKIEPLVGLAVEQGLLIKIAPNLCYTLPALERGRAVCQALLLEHGDVSVARLRDEWKVSRKHSIPLCEWFDSIGVLQRQLDVHVAGVNLCQPLSQTLGAIAKARLLPDNSAGTGN